MSISELKETIKRGGLNYVGLTEKSEMVALAKEAQIRIEQGKAAPTAPAPSAEPTSSSTSAATEPPTVSIEAIKERCATMSVSELKKTIVSGGKSFAGVTEKHELITLAVEAAVMVAMRKPSFFEKPLGLQLLTKNGIKSTSEVLEGKDYVLFYFSAHWCPPCRKFTPMLSKLYIEENRDCKFEIIFISSDRSESEFDDYYEEMPWTALPYGNPQNQAVQAKYGAQGIPELVVLSKDGVVVKKGAVQNVYQSGIRGFPWN